MSSYRRYFSPAQVESDQKDIIIAQLKAEIFELRKNEEDYLTLQEELRKLDQKYRQAQEEKQIYEQEFKQKCDNNQRLLIKHSEEREAVQQDFFETQKQIKDYHSENVSLKSLCDQRQFEIQKYKAEIAENLDRSVILSEDKNKFEISKADLSRDLTQLKSQIEDLKINIEEVKAKNNELQVFCSDLETQKQTMLKQQAQIEEDCIQTQNEIKKKSQIQKEIENEIIQTQRNIRKHEQDIRSFTNINEKAVAEARHYINNLQGEIAKNQDCQNKIVNMEQFLRQKEQQVEGLKTNIEEVHKDNNEIQEANAKLAQDIEACAKHIEQLNYQNRELSENINFYCDQDEQVKALLNRRNRAKEAIQKSEAGIKFSQNIGLFQRSPLKQQQKPVRNNKGYREITNKYYE